jgi:hypothetical protein
VALVAAFLLVLVMLPTLAATARSLPELGASASPAASPAQAIAGPWILVGAGDIATGPPGAIGPDERTAQLIDKIVTENPGRVTVFTAGDNAYEDGTPGDFRHYFEATWGRHKSIMRPVPGNHEYQSEDAAGYFDYFGPGAGDAETGFYAYDLGSWRVYALNSEIEVSAGMFQEQWLREDLAAHAETRCVAAYWHRPRFSRGPHGSAEDIRPLWQALYDFNAELVISGHDHNYQRFAPMTADGALDAARGLRQWVVGTGGRQLNVIDGPIANTEAWNSSTYGVLKLTLHETSYDFEFVPVAGSAFADKGQAIACH